MLKIDARNLGSVVVLCLRGRIVNGETEALRRAVDSLKNVRAVVLDLAGVNTIDASGLGVLLELRQQTESNDIRFKLMNVTRLVLSVLEITRLDSVFEITSAREMVSADAPGRPASMSQFAVCT
jgi:anti-anti-sigma factor